MVSRNSSKEELMEAFRNNFDVEAFKQREDLNELIEDADVTFNDGRIVVKSQKGYTIREISQRMLVKFIEESGHGFLLED